MGRDDRAILRREVDAVMLRYFLALLLLPSVALAQLSPGGGGGSSAYLPLTGGTLTGAITTVGITDSGGINTTAVSGYSQYGNTILAMTAGAAGQQAVFVGPGSGAYALTNGLVINYGGVALGVNSGSSINSAAAEFALGGAYSGQYATNPYAMTAWGEHTIGYDNCHYCTAIGGDAMRGTTGANLSTAVGAQSMDDGTGSANTGVGALSLQGNAGSILFTGTISSGSKWCIPFTTTNGAVMGLPASACYTTTGADTLTTLAAGLASSVSGLGVWTPGGGPVPGNGVQLAALSQSASGSPIPILAFHFPGGNTTGWAIQPGTPVCTLGPCTEVLTVQAPFSGTDILALGAGSVFANALAAPVRIIGIGDYSLSSLQGSPSDIICIGYECGANATSGASTQSVLMGSNQALNATVLTGDVIINGLALTALTTGTKNTLINGGNDISTGLGNVEIGYGSTVPSGTTNWQLSIMDAIYGTNCNKGGGGSSNCQIGIGQSAPGAKLDVLGFDTSATLAFRVQNSTPTNLLSVSDAGVIAVGAGAFTANGSTVLSLTSLGPSGAHATVQEWFTITDSGGTVRYIPAF